MKRDFNVTVRDSESRPHVRQVFKYDANGMPIINKDSSGRPVHEPSHFEPMTLRLYAIDALAGRWRGEEDMTPKQAIERMKLHDKLAMAADGVVDITTDEANILMKAMENQRGSPLVMARMQLLIDTDPAATQTQG